MTEPTAAAFLIDHPCLGIPGPTEHGIGLGWADGETEIDRAGRLGRRERLALAVQAVATAALLWEMGYWPGCSGFSNARILRDERGVRLMVSSVPRTIDVMVRRLGGGDAAIRRLRDGVLRAIGRRAGLPSNLFGAVEGPDWLDFEPWLERLLDRLGTPLDHWTARSLWALSLEPLPVPGRGEVGYWAVPWPGVAARLAAAVHATLRGMGERVLWLASGKDEAATAPMISAGEGGGALVLTGVFEPSELRAVERWLGGGAGRRAVVIGRFPAGWDPEMPVPVNGDAMDRSLWIAGVDGETVRMVRRRWQGRFQAEFLADEEALTLLATRRFHGGSSSTPVLDPAATIVRRCLGLLPEGVPVPFAAVCSGLDEAQVRATARSLGAVSREGLLALPVPEPLRPDPLHLKAAGLLGPDDPRRLLAQWLGGGAGDELLRWARQRLEELDGLAVLRLLGMVDTGALDTVLLEVLAEAALDTLDVALLRSVVQALPETIRPVWLACLEAVDGEAVRALPPPTVRDVHEHPRACSEVALRLLELRRHRGGGDLQELAGLVVAAAARLGGLLGRRLEMEARMLAEPALLDDRRWRREMTADSQKLRRALRRRAGLVRMSQGRYREAMRLLAPLAEDEELPGRAGLLELDLGALTQMAGLREEADRRLLRSLRLLRAAGFIHRTRVVSFDLGVGELDRLRVTGARRRFQEAGDGEGDPVARAELARLALAAGDEAELERLRAGLPRGEEARETGLVEAVALLDGVAALLRHDLPGARELLGRGGEEGRAWMPIVAVLDGGPRPAAVDGDGWGLGLCATVLATIRKGDAPRMEELLPRGCTSAREALALALCERLAGRQGWLGHELRRQAARILHSQGLTGWETMIAGKGGGERLLIELSSRVLERGEIDAVPKAEWLKLLQSLGASGLELRSRAGGPLLWHLGEGTPGEEIQRGLVGLVALGGDGVVDERWELLASVLATVAVAEAPRDSLDDDLGMIGCAPLMEELRTEIRRMAPSVVPVVLLGETGVGKELAARAIHRLSGRPGPFVAINMAALPQELAEAELFGAVKGAFTGADRTRRGLIAAADGGTLFLDEIGELELRLQAKLLRFLESSEVRPVGSESVRAVDVRIVSASNRNLETAQREGSFRPDLFYRIASAQVHVPPLRQRREDIPALIEHFSRRVTLREGGAPAVWGLDAVEEMQRYEWPGNVRELRNVVEVALLRAGGGTVRRRHLPLAGLEQADDSEPTELDYEAAIQAFRRRLIVRALERNGGNRSATARKLGISRQTLLYHIRSLGIT
ncbi:MAG: AAA domain-containing protein [Acidobacteria bacterium]|nr:AAA domain-containing protein [Acidobacteriota bacterium]